MVDLGGIQNKLEKNKNAKKIHTHTHTLVAKFASYVPTK